MSRNVLLPLAVLALAASLANAQMTGQMNEAQLTEWLGKLPAECAAYILKNMETGLACNSENPDPTKMPAEQLCKTSCAKLAEGMPASCVDYIAPVIPNIKMLLQVFNDNCKREGGAGPQNAALSAFSSGLGLALLGLLGAAAVVMV